MHAQKGQLWTCDLQGIIFVATETALDKGEVNEKDLASIIKYN